MYRKWLGKIYNKLTGISQERTDSGMEGEY